MRDDEPVGVGLPALFIPQLRSSGQALYPILTEAPSANVLRYSGTWRLRIDGQEQPATAGSFTNLTAAELQQAAPSLLSSTIAQHGLQNRTVEIRAVASGGQVVASAGLAPPVSSPSFSTVRRNLPVAPKKAWWSLTAFAISCPTCPKKVVSKVGPLPFTIDQITSLAAGYKKQGVQLEIRRQRRADEPDAGAWYRTFWPQGDVGTLESLGGTKV